MRCQQRQPQCVASREEGAFAALTAGLVLLLLGVMLCPGLLLPVYIWPSGPPATFHHAGPTLAPLPLLWPFPLKAGSDMQGCWGWRRQGARTESVYNFYIIKVRTAIAGDNCACTELKPPAFRFLEILQELDMAIGCSVV